VVQPGLAVGRRAGSDRHSRVPDVTMRTEYGAPLSKDEGGCHATIGS
jgi:hypothetical protein